MSEEAEEEESGCFSPRVGMLPPIPTGYGYTPNRLLEGLRRIDGEDGFLGVSPVAGSPRRGTLLSPRPICHSRAASDPSTSQLGSLSRIGVRANARASEAMEAVIAHDSRHSFALGTASGGSSGSAAATSKATNDGVSAAKSFEHIMAGIDGALCGGSGACTLLRRGEELGNESVPAHASRHYRVQLPTVPTRVVVVLTRTSGTMPAIWGSTTSERPHAKNHEFRSKDGVLNYDHVLVAIDETDEANNAVRRQIAPPARDLWLTVQAEPAEGATFELLVSFKPAKPLMSRQEITSQVQRIRRGWEARLGELQREPHQREEFEERLRRQQASVSKERLKCWGGKDFTALNAASIMESAPAQKLAKLQSRALHRFAKQDAVLERRRIKEQEVADRKAAWFNRAEVRRQHATILQHMVDNEDRQRTWLQLLTVLAFACQAQVQLDEVLEMKAFIAKKVFAVQSLQSWCLRVFTAKRKKAVYMTAMRLRIAMAAYCRTVRLVNANVAQPVVLRFLTGSFLKQDAPELASYLARFRTRVIKLQRWILRIRRMRQAWHQVIQPHWAHSEAIALKQLVAAGVHKEKHREQAAKQQLQRQKSFLLRRSRTSQHALEPPPPPDRIPKHLSNMLLKEYIVSMHHSYRARYLAWEAARAQLAFQKDLAGFGVQADAQVVTLAQALPPRPVYVDMDEITATSRAKVALVLQGQYRWVIFRRQHLTRKAVKGLHIHLQRAKKVQSGLVFDRERLSRCDTSLSMVSAMSPTGGGGFMSPRFSVESCAGVASSTRFSMDIEMQASVQ